MKRGISDEGLGRIAKQVDGTVRSKVGDYQDPDVETLLDYLYEREVYAADVLYALIHRMPQDEVANLLKEIIERELGHPFPG